MKDLRETPRAGGNQRRHLLEAPQDFAVHFSQDTARLPEEADAWVQDDPALRDADLAAIPSSPPRDCGRWRRVPGTGDSSDAMRMSPCAVGDRQGHAGSPRRPLTSLRMAAPASRAAEATALRVVSAEMARTRFAGSSRWPAEARRSSSSEMEVSNKGGGHGADVQDVRPVGHHPVSHLAEGVLVPRTEPW